jgi:hypothetical protein
MGTLKPGATYIYERANGVTYAREFGADPMTRKVIGYDYTEQAMQKAFEASIHSEDEESQKWRGIYEEERLWTDIRDTAKSNPALQKAIERVILVYRLSKDDPK